MSLYSPLQSLRGRLLFAILCFPLPLRGQLFSLEIDSMIVDSRESIPFSYLPIEACGFFLTPPEQQFLFIQDSAAFTNLIESKRFIGQCKDLEIPHVDFTRHAVVGFNLFLDCNARVWIRLVREADTAAAGYSVVVNTEYGGCRGMRPRSHWLVIPALKEGERVVMEERELPEKRE